MQILYDKTDFDEHQNGITLKLFSLLFSALFKYSNPLNRVTEVLLVQQPWKRSDSLELHTSSSEIYT